MARIPKPKPKPNKPKPRVPVPTRKVPSQERSRERVARILHAAAEVFAESGFEAATTEAIALRAGASIGSLYQFFPNKRALFQAMALRYAARLRELGDALLTFGLSSLPWTTILDRSIDALSEFHRDDPGFRAILRNWSSGEFTEHDDAMNREFAQRTEVLLASMMPGLRDSERPIVATVVVETISAMLIFANRKSAKVAQQVMDQTKVLLRRYLKPYERRGRVPGSPYPIRRER